MEEPTTIGLTEESHGILKRLKDEGHFAEMADAYRFAIALALSLGQEPPLVGGSRQTIFNVGTLDPDRALYYAVKILARRPRSRSTSMQSGWLNGVSRSCGGAPSRDESTS